MTSMPVLASCFDNSGVSSVPLVISSTRAPSSLARRTISTIRGWNRGSPKPPKNTVGTGEKSFKPSTMRSNTASDIMPSGSSHTLLEGLLVGDGGQHGDLLPVTPTTITLPSTSRSMMLDFGPR